MAGRNQYKADDFIIAIKGSGGVIAVIAQRVGCAWNTAEKYMKTFPTVKRAWEDEKEITNDYAESVVTRNIQIALKLQQETNQVVDSSDAKWLLSRRRRDEYSEKFDIGGLLRLIDYSKLTDEQLSRLERGDNPIDVLLHSGTG